MARRTRLLFETSQNLQKAESQREIIQITAGQLLKIFQRDIVAYPVNGGELGQPEVFPANESLPGDMYSSEKERQAAQQPAQNKAPKEKKERTVTAEAAQKKNQKQLEKQIAKLEREIEKQEAKLEALEPQIQEAAADYTRLSELLEQQTETQAQLDEMYAQWEQLSSDLEA